MAGVPPATPTRQRLIDAATTLFASQGIHATTVAEIEGAAGLRAGSGGLHRHFPTKNDLVRAVLDAQLTRAETDVVAASELPRPDPEHALDYLDALGRMMLERANAHRDIALIMLRESGTLPEGVLDEHHRRNFDITYSTVAASLRDRADIVEGELGMDPDALAFVLLAPIIYFRLIEWATGSTVLGLTDDTIVATWARVFEPIVRALADRAD